MKQITDAEHLKTFLWYKAYKENLSCLLCHSKKKIEFHHIYPKGDPEKRSDKFMAVSQMVYYNFELCDIKDEINKTIPLCQKCHTNYHKKLGF